MLEKYYDIKKADKFATELFNEFEDREIFFDEFVAITKEAFSLTNLLLLPKK